MGERLPRLPQNVGLFLPSGKPSQTMQRWWERVCEEIETSRSRMDDIQNIIVRADHAGAVLTGELPRNIICKRYFLESDVTASSLWTVALTSGSIGVAIGAATGVLTLSAVSGTIAASSVVKVTSVRQGVTLTKSFTITRGDNIPPSGTGGGTSASDSTLASINSSSMAAITDELTITIGTAGVATLSAPLDVSTAAAASAGTFEVYGRWQWWDGAVWVDQGASETASEPDCAVEAESGSYYVTNGYLSVSASKTGLAASSSHKFRLMARKFSGTRVMTFTGTASAVGS